MSIQRCWRRDNDKGPPNCCRVEVMTRRSVTESRSANIFSSDVNIACRRRATSVASFDDDGADNDDDDDEEADDESAEHDNADGEDEDNNSSPL